MVVPGVRGSNAAATGPGFSSSTRGAGGRILCYCLGNRSGNSIGDTSRYRLRYRNGSSAGDPSHHRSGKARTSMSRGPFGCGLVPSWSSLAPNKPWGSRSPSDLRTAQGTAGWARGNAVR